MKLALDTAEVIADYERLGSAAKVAREHGCSKRTILRLLASAGVARRDRGAERAQRLQKIAELERAGVPRGEMPARLGISLSMLYVDLHALGFEERRPRKHPRPEPRQCLECGEPFTPKDASQVARGDGRFCSPRCARRHESARTRARETASKRHLRAAEKVARICAEESCTTAQAFAAELGVAANTLTGQYIPKPLPAERRLVEGEQVWFIRLAEAERFEREDWPPIRRRAMELWADHHLPRTWSLKRRKAWTRRVVGNKTGGRPPRPLPPKMLAEVEGLLARGRGRPAVQAATGLSEYEARKAIDQVRNRP